MAASGNVSDDRFFFDEETAQRHVDFLKEVLVFGTGELVGQPFLPMPWQEHATRQIHGWRRKVDGKRRYRIVYLFIPRGNGKTEWCAATANDFLFNDELRSPQVILGAGTGKQAKDPLYRSTRTQIEQSPILSTKATVYAEAIERHRGGNLLLVAADGDLEHGKQPTGIVLDELHAHKRSNLYNAMVTALPKSPGATMVLPTTAGFRVSHGPWPDVHKYAMKVHAGDIDDPQFLPIIYHDPDKDVDILDESAWERANPALDITIDRDALRQQALQAKGNPTAEAAFRCYHLNQITDRDSGWMSTAPWQAIRRPIDEAAYEGKRCMAGLDLADTKDLCSFITLFEDGTLLSRFWCPGDRLDELRTRGELHYDEWVREGRVTICPGPVVDYQVVLADIVAMTERFTYREIGYDPMQASLLVSSLMTSGLRMIKVPQNINRMSEPYKELERMVMRGQFSHDCPVLVWMVGNAVARRDAHENLMLNKQRSTGAIDGLQALGIALHCKMNTTLSSAEVQFVSSPRRSKNRFFGQ